MSTIPCQWGHRTLRQLWLQLLRLLFLLLQPKVPHGMMRPCGQTAQGRNVPNTNNGWKLMLNQRFHKKILPVMFPVILKGMKPKFQITPPRMPSLKWLDHRRSSLAEINFPFVLGRKRRMQRPRNRRTIRPEKRRKLTREKHRPKLRRRKMTRPMEKDQNQSKRRKASTALDGEGGMPDQPKASAKAKSKPSPKSKAVKKSKSADKKPEKKKSQKSQKNQKEPKESQKPEKKKHAKKTEKTGETDKKPRARSIKVSEVDVEAHPDLQAEIASWVNDNIDYKDLATLKACVKEARLRFDFFRLNIYWTTFKCGLTMRKNGEKEGDVANFSFFEKTLRACAVAIACAEHLAYYMDESDAPDVAAFEKSLEEWKQAYQMAGAAVLHQNMV
ncbi:unnamed protein product [Cladocopium goreaui]|uniref:Uncharacterized protein n=1 Tax=Cladocopium goreaui TaxID=2562237 RepID=A0A9P1CLM8_9DINO|nr:unnamed protein product [Cladocopium goreaui]